jgi:hypothetical protein
MRAWTGVAVGLLLVGVVLGVASVGGFGPLVVCGVDGWAVCVAWPRIVGALVWLAFIGGIVALVGWHVHEWRHAADSEHNGIAQAVSTGPQPGRTKTDVKSS